MTTQVAQQTRKVADVIAIPVEDFSTMSLEELNELHTFITNEGTTKPAKNKAFLIKNAIDNKRKEERKNKAEPVAYSAKEQAPVAATTETPKPATNRRRKPVATAEPAAPAKPATPNKPKPKTVEKKPEEMTQEELVEQVKRLEGKKDAGKVERFPAELALKDNKYKLTKISFKDHVEIGRFLTEKPYTLFCTIDEQIDKDLTMCIVVYASDSVLLAVDKSRHKESIFTIAPESIAKEVWTFKEGKETFKFPFAFYMRERK